MTVTWPMIVGLLVHCRVVRTGSGLHRVLGCRLGSQVCLYQVVIASSSWLQARGSSRVDVYRFVVVSGFWWRAGGSNWVGVAYWWKSG